MASDPRDGAPRGIQARRDNSRPSARRTLRSVPTGGEMPPGTATAGDPATVADRLDGRIALVTGAGSPDGIGYASARRLGALGATVAIVSTTRRIHDRASELG